MALTPAQEQAITGIRTAQGWGPDRIALVLRLPRATVHRAIVRLGLRRTRVPAPPAARYERAGPGDLVHIDTKKLGRIIGGPGHRVTGDRRSRSRGAGWTVIHAAIDDATRVAYVELLPDECGVTASGFLSRMVAHFRRLGIPVQRVLTDNGSQYVSGVWKAACADLGVGARRTRPYRPQTNGKVERWFQTVLRECLYLHPLANEDERQRALDTFVEYYNHDRPHLGIKGLTPLSRLASLSTTL
jgi:transposase InsO family protein